MDTIRRIINDIITFINEIAIPFLFAIAMLMFLWGVFNYLLNPQNAEKRQEGVKFITWGIVGFFVMISVWGLVRVVVGTFDFDNTSRPCVPTFSGTCANRSGTRTTTQPPAPANPATPPAPFTPPPSRIGPPEP